MTVQIIPNPQIAALVPLVLEPPADRTVLTWDAGDVLGAGPAVVNGDLSVTGDASLLGGNGTVLIQQDNDSFFLRTERSDATNPIELRTTGWGILQIFTGGKRAFQINADGHHIIDMTGPAISNNAFVDGNLELYAATPGAPRIGFHESGHSGLALYKPAGDGTTLRVRTNGGIDYALARAPGTETWGVSGDGAAHDLYPTAWTAYEVPGIAPLSITLRDAAKVRLDWFCQFYTQGPSVTYFQVSIDGAWTGSIPTTVPINNTVTTAHGFLYADLAAGAHTIKLGFTPTLGGNPLWHREAWYTSLAAIAFYRNT